MNINMENIAHKKLLVKELFKLCFNDTELFTDFYFQKRYSEENNFAIFQDEKPVAALQAIPYEMTSFDTKINLSYLSAICTHPDFRNQGLMTQLLQTTINQLFTNEIHATFLIPAELQLFGIYKKYDFETVFYRSVQQIDTTILATTQYCKILDFSTVDKHKVFDYFNSEMHKRNCCVQHSEYDFDTICEDIYNSEGIILIAECENKISGLCFVLKLNGNVTVVEHFADNFEVKKQLFKAVSQKMKADAVTCFFLPNIQNNTAFGMLRIVCAEKMLQFYASTHPYCKTKIYVKDDIIAENNGCYVISNAQCKKLPLETEHGSWNIAQFTRFVFEGQMPYMSLMINE